MDADISELIDRALAEDVGDGDVDHRGHGRRRTPAARATITQKAPGVISGLDVAEAVFRRARPRRARRAARRRRASGARPGAGAARRGLGAGAAHRRAHGAELPRPALRASRRRPRASSRAVAGGRGAKILDTRKTTPGLRALEKRAVADGGGVNHRIGLLDFILIKENHAALAGGVGEAVRRARAARPDLAARRRGARRAPRSTRRWTRGAPRLLLDNMTPDAGARGGRAGRRPGGARGVAVASTTRQFWSMRPLRGYTTSRWAHSPTPRPVLDLSLILETAPVNPPHARIHPRPAVRGARAGRRARRRDPRPQLPAARGPGRGRLRRRLARPLAAGRARPTPR